MPENGTANGAATPAGKYMLNLDTNVLGSDYSLVEGVELVTEVRLKTALYFDTPEKAQEAWYAAMRAAKAVQDA